jgi:hypothetical protein
VPSGRGLRGVLCNFLGTYTSRYSDYDGYWLFGFLTDELGAANFDLLDEGVRGSDDLLREAHLLAADAFQDQLRKSGLDRMQVAAARLRVDQLTPARHFVNGVARDGRNYRFVANATADTGHRFECWRIVFVSPHDPRLERRSVHGPGRRSSQVRGRLDARRSPTDSPEEG